MGIPHSRFLKWDVEDREKALAWRVEQDLRCPRCGTAEWEWVDDPFAYQARFRRCMGCMGLEYADSGLHHRRPDPNAGTHVELRRRADG